MLSKYQKMIKTIDEKGFIWSGICIQGTRKGEHLLWTQKQENSLEDRLEQVGSQKIGEIEGQTWYVECFLNMPRIVICGGGHVSKALADLAHLLEFNVFVMDEREEFVSKERFPYALVRKSGTYKEIIKDLEDSLNTYYVVMTPGHLKDRDALKGVLEKSALYVGMIGSKAKVAHTFKALQEEGISKEKLEKVHAPIGLPIGGQRPSEIAVSIMAEIIKERSSFETSILEEEIREGLDKEEGILACIVTSRGSAPRHVGTRMLITRDGQYGTIGGGALENACILHGREMLAQDESFGLEKYQLSNTEGAKLGMVCGGNVEVWFEKVGP